MIIWWCSCTVDDAQKIKDPPKTLANREFLILMLVHTQPLAIVQRYCYVFLPVVAPD